MGFRIDNDGFGRHLADVVAGDLRERVLTIGAEGGRGLEGVGTVTADVADRLACEVASNVGARVAQRL